MASGVQHQMAPGGPHQMAPGGQTGMGVPGGKQVYSTSSSDWDGNTYTQKSYKEETESSDTGNRSYRQQTTQVCYGYIQTYKHTNIQT